LFIILFIDRFFKEYTKRFSQKAPPPCPTEHEIAYGIFFVRLCSVGIVGIVYQDIAIKGQVSQDGEMAGAGELAGFATHDYRVPIRHSR
jgi:hypothetical protein